MLQFGVLVVGCKKQTSDRRCGSVENENDSLQS
jgi:hypothetical protein